MGDDDASAALPWLWVIEALASFSKITTSTLQGLIDAAPVGADDFCENTRELIAMKCLEELSTASPNGVDLDASSTLDSRAGFDFSRSCEDVLQEILHEIPLSNLKMAGAELLKQDVYPFIMHKSAGTVKCHLEQLQESILGGTLPLSDSLKERSGLFQRNRGYTVHVNDGECNDHLEKDDGNTAYAENMGAKENSMSLNLENGNNSSKEQALDNNFLPSKRNMVYSADEDSMGYLHEKQVCINECDNFLRSTKRIKCYGSTSFVSKLEKPDSRLGKEVSENSTEKIILISEEGGHYTEKNNRETLSDGSFKDGHNRCSASNLCQSSSHNEAFHNESNIPFNATLMPPHTFGGENSQQQQVESIPTNVGLPDGIQNKIPGSKPCSKCETNLQIEDPNGSQQTVSSSDKAQVDTSNGCGVDISGDKIVYQGEKINLVVKKHEEQKLDMSCNEDGQLLVCDVTTVPIVVPESCLGMTTTIDPQHTSGAEPCQNTSMDETNDTVHVEPIPTNDDNAPDKIQHTIGESQPKQKEQNVASLNVSQKPIASDKIVVDTTANGCGAELSSDSDGYHNEKIDLAARKHELLSSQCTFGQDLSLMTESTEQNLCMKCNEDGQLLVCKTTTCRLMVHKNCLGASTQLDAEGNFICPFCMYSHSISKYLEAKKKASLARKELAIFISKGIGNQAKEHVHEFHRQAPTFSRKSGSCEHIHVKNDRNDLLTGYEENREDHVGKHANDVDNLQLERSQQQPPTSRVHSSCREKENVDNGLTDDVRREEKGVEMLNANSLTGGTRSQQQPPTSRVHSSCREKENVDNGLTDDVRREEEGVEMLNANSLTGGTVEGKEVPTDHVDGHGGDKFSGKNAIIVSGNESNAGEKVPQNMTKQHNMDGTVEPICAQDTGKEEISEDECKKHVISRYSMRLHKREILYKPQASPQSRRKKIPWTAEEEELIREGVQKFGFTWKKILAFGSHVFEKDDRRRTAQDLKDKWKNMCKAHAKLDKKASS